MPSLILWLAKAWHWLFDPPPPPTPRPIIIHYQGYIRMLQTYTLTVAPSPDPSLVSARSLTITVNGVAQEGHAKDGETFKVPSGATVTLDLHDVGLTGVPSLVATTAFTAPPAKPSPVVANHTGEEVEPTA